MWSARMEMCLVVKIELWRGGDELWRGGHEYLFDDFDDFYENFNFIVCR